MIAINQPCNDCTCPEWHNGQCFGDGCWRNPASANWDKASEAEGESEDEE